MAASHVGLSTRVLGSEKIRHPFQRVCFGSLLGKKVGETAMIKTPAGEIEFQVMNITL